MNELKVSLALVVSRLTFRRDLAELLNFRRFEKKWARRPAEIRQEHSELLMYGVTGLSKGRPNASY